MGNKQGGILKHLDQFGEPLDQETIDRIVVASRTSSRAELSKQFAVGQKTLRRILASGASK